MSCPWLTLHRMEYCFRWVWEAASASLVLIHSYPRPHVLVQIYMVALASVADPRLFDPRVGDDKTYITTMGMQRTSVHGRTTSCCKTGWENRTWWSPAPSSGSTTWPQWKERSFFQDHLWVIWTMEAGITTFIWFLVCALWLLLSQWLSCLVQFHLRGRGWTNFSPLFNDWDDTGPPPICTSRLWVTWDIYMWDLLWHREAVLSGLGTFWKRSVSRSFLGVFLGCVGLVLVGLFCCFCVCVVLKTPSFLLSPILQHVGIAYLRQNVLMTVWASSAHGMSSKKKSPLVIRQLQWKEDKYSQSLMQTETCTE